ncbi:MAG: bifunctional demethylmenaquinone methyltransferase/2-methoxy-6-polyprenyl-1,4-benzoquinol methylase [Coxiella sp. RIFCSPHIGHO2_12_FULL_44_14]|nr:MAG: bifunctional demethylmenaquinone methyltransferase/2-methoxy-6-polyprenyl-1,4-benzoquinol methylase [Coxiella sp. RIFCSPHIGHO2_12_FULL_44_14]
MNHKKTDFGFEEVAWDEKTTRVKAVFSSVADKYDLMNDLMSLGIQRIWKHFAIHLCAVRTGQRVLDLAGGSGDLTRKLSPLVGKDGHVILADINNAMLEVGRGRLLDEGIFQNIHFVQANAEQLPFAAHSFDRIIIGFGLRNVTDKAAALQSMYRVLKPGGRLMILEFSAPTSTPLKKIYDFYSFKLLPKLGRFIANDEESYRYLVESIRMHPHQETLLNMMSQAGFEDNDFHNLSGGIVALHRGYKYE